MVMVWRATGMFTQRWFPSPRKHGNSKVGTATMGEAKSVRVMGHRHAISNPLSCPSPLPFNLTLSLFPHVIRTFNFARTVLPCNYPLFPSHSTLIAVRGTSSPRNRVLHCDLSALIIRRQESRQIDDQVFHPFS